ncbi:hypothetical protein [Winogradskyella sp.]|uniref:hypothetical protein n=1 Tax=Winogradskyella sp. TaxID=1883156 RepID=UPI00261D1BC5|nr:hypothetical protein [Winogradskyella sp.]
MKRILSFMTVFTLLLTACEGDQGLPGPPGPPGETGGLIVADAIPVQNVNFTAPDFEIIVDFDQIFSDEVLLVYRRWENNTWRLLPQTIIFDDGSDLVYNFDFTQNDVAIFLESTAELETLGPQWTQNQTFRIVIVPAESINGVNISDINEVIRVFNIESLEINQTD